MLAEQTNSTTVGRHPMSTSAIIFLFALAHAVVAVAGRALNYYDDVPLTLLTISMVVIISIRHRLQLELTVIITLFASFVGFLTGIYGALALRTILRNDYLAPALTTFIITELVGWSAYTIARRRGNDDKKPGQWTPPARYVILITSFILVIRLGYILILRRLFDSEESLYPELSRLFSNTFALLLLISGNLICIHLYDRSKGRTGPRWHYPLWVIATLAGISVLTSLCVVYGPSSHLIAARPTDSFFRLLILVLLICIATFAFLSLGYYVVASYRELKHERQKRHLAQYQYSKFKQQINPHFLFNSLNILDVLVQEGENDRASTFVRKLAGMYRYMLRNEEETLVTLREEMEFAEMYVDLIKERFTDGLDIRYDIPDDAYPKLVVPCSVQQLVENATKHNIVSSDEPLHVRITATDTCVAVENNLQPRISQRGSSTHLGLKYIQQQYLDIASRLIAVERDAGRFRVELPLLKPSKP